jgi:hypothetical protein
LKSFAKTTFAISFKASIVITYLLTRNCHMNITQLKE